MFRLFSLEESFKLVQAFIILGIVLQPTCTSHYSVILFCHHFSESGCLLCFDFNEIRKVFKILLQLCHHGMLQIILRLIDEC